MNNTDSTVTNKRAYPESVYQHALGHGFFPDDGITVEAAETIASTKPDWASFEHTDLAPSAAENGILLTTWASSNGDVSITQDTYYREDTGEKTSENTPAVYVWGDDGATRYDSDKARRLAFELLQAADLLDRITDPAAAIVDKSDPRWAEFAAWLADKNEIPGYWPAGGTAHDIKKDFAPIERGEWYASKILGMDDRAVFRTQHSDRAIVLSAIHQYVKKAS